MHFQQFGSGLLFVLVTVPAFSQTSVSLPLQPAGSWVLNVPLNSGGVCKPCLNPMEITFSNVTTSGGPGVQMTSHSTQAQCCTCIRRSKPFPLGVCLNTTQNAVHLTGWFSAARSPDDAFSVASMGITLVKSGKGQFGQIFVAEIRPNNNCATFPQTVLASGADFDIGLDSLAPNIEFDEIVVHTMGYACAVSSPNSVAIANFSLQHN